MTDDARRPDRSDHPRADDQGAGEDRASEGLTHLDDAGAARMVDVGEKGVTDRVARAAVDVVMAPETRRAVLEGGGPKGDALQVARLAGIMGAKRTPELIPL